jgi:hypothetical protein
MILIDDDSITLEIYRGIEVSYECIICGDGKEYNYDNIDDHTRYVHGLIPYALDEWIQAQRVLR